jgi:hypothetical protein
MAQFSRVDTSSTLSRKKKLTFNGKKSSIGPEPTDAMHVVQAWMGPANALAIP